MQAWGLCNCLVKYSNLKIDKAEIENSSFETVLNRLFGIFFFFFYSTFITGNIMSSMVIGHGFPQLETSTFTFKVSSEGLVGCSLKVFLDATDTEINETISKCGINQEIIQKSCGDGKIESSTLYLLMGIFRLWSQTYFFCRLHRCWWRILETKCVGDKFEMLVTDSGCWWPI